MSALVVDDRNSENYAFCEWYARVAVEVHFRHHRRAPLPQTHDPLSAKIVEAFRADKMPREVAAMIARHKEPTPDLREAAELASMLLSGLSTDSFGSGGDAPIRAALDFALKIETNPKYMPHAHTGDSEFCDVCGHSIIGHD